MWLSFSTCAAGWIHLNQMREMGLARRCPHVFLSLAAGGALFAARPR
jgi:hypothetical protein